MGHWSHGYHQRLARAYPDRLLYGVQRNRLSHRFELPVVLSDCYCQPHSQESKRREVETGAMESREMGTSDQHTRGVLHNNHGNLLILPGGSAGE